MQGSGSEALLDNLTCHSRVLTDAEKYEMLITLQTGLCHSQLDTRYIEIKGSRKLIFNENGFKITLGSVILLRNPTREDGAYRVVFFLPKQKRNIWELLLGHPLLII